MKRDMDLVLLILQEIEKKNAAKDWMKISSDKFSDEVVSYHIMLLDQANYIEGIDLSTKSGFQWQAINLTWEGHEFLDNARNKKVWNKMKKFLKDKAISVSFDLVKDLLISFTKEEIGIGK